MRSALFAFLLFFLSPVSLALAQQVPTPVPPSSDTTSPPAIPTATKDAQAVGVVNQALAVAGGVPAIVAITDYTATGNVTYQWAQDLQGTVTVRGAGLGQLRVDANLPNGVRSEVIDGQTTIKTEDGGVRQLHSQSPMIPSRFILPYLLLRPAVSSVGYSLLYKGVVQIGSQSVHEIQLRRILLTPDPDGRFTDYFTVNFFIDASTFQVVMMQDVVGPNRATRQIQYSDYRLANGLLVPFSISEQVIGQPTRLIQLTQITFNSGLQDSDFQL